MAKRLTQAAITRALSDSGLYKTITDLLGVLPGSTDIIIKRNGNKVNRYDVVEAIAKHMGVHPSEIQEEVQLKVKEVQAVPAG